MLRIERSGNGQVVFTVSGRMQAEDIEQFQQLLIAEAPGDVRSARCDARESGLRNISRPLQSERNQAFSGVLSMSEIGLIKRSAAKPEERYLTADSLSCGQSAI
jgi:hypothetical protein